MWRMGYDSGKGRKISLPLMVLVMRLKGIRALEPHLSFPNLVLRDTNSANFPGHRATEGDGDGDVPRSLRKIHRLSCLHLLLSMP